MVEESGLPHPWKKSLKSLNFKSILEKSLNFSENFGGSLKSPWNLKMILEILEFCTQCYTLHATSSNRCRYTAFSPYLDPIWASLKIAARSLKYPWISQMEFRGNPGNILSRLYYSPINNLHHVSPHLIHNPHYTL